MTGIIQTQITDRYFIIDSISIINTDNINFPQILKIVNYNLTSNILKLQTIGLVYKNIIILKSNPNVNEIVDNLYDKLNNTIKRACYPQEMNSKNIKIEELIGLQT